MNKNKEKKLGIIVPSYNQGKYIEETIKSIIENRNYCLLKIAIIDGGSSDETIEIIKKYEREIDFWVSEKDNGQANAINKGIKILSDCDYYMWLNSDDIYEEKNALEKIMDYAIKNKFDIVYGRSHFIDEKGKILGEYPTEKVNNKSLSKNCGLSQPSVMFSRKAYLEIGEINEKLEMCLDYEYWIRLSFKFKFGYIDEFIGATRIYNETKTTTMKQVHLDEAITILKSHYKNVPMKWIVTKVLEENQNIFLNKIPKRLLYFLLFPLKKKVIKESSERKDYDKNFI